MPTLIFPGNEPRAHNTASTIDAKIESSNVHVPTLSRLGRTMKGRILTSIALETPLATPGDLAERDELCDRLSTIGMGSGSVASTAR